ncbi:hypothetical protein NDU88_001404 [Pleurodeles waltl]|uniref:Uncharacterized protein n=1 Tax=Pleurodeles waltl TaxID=8319 RepID=A0AAV7KPH2_PLEWA|nr:hypothetical protein NDU88_001404 [Pleurodeles waltl]
MKPRDFSPSGLSSRSSPCCRGWAAPEAARQYLRASPEERSSRSARAEGRLSARLDRTTQPGVHVETHRHSRQRDKLTTLAAAPRKQRRTSETEFLSHSLLDRLKDVSATLPA